MKDRVRQAKGSIGGIDPGSRPGGSIKGVDQEGRTEPGSTPIVEVQQKGWTLILFDPVIALQSVAERCRALQSVAEPLGVDQEGRSISGSNQGRSGG